MSQEFEKGREGMDREILEQLMIETQERSREIVNRLGWAGGLGCERVG